MCTEYNHMDSHPFMAKLSRHWQKVFRRSRSLFRLGGGHCALFWSGMNLMLVTICSQTDVLMPLRKATSFSAMTECLVQRGVGSGLANPLHPATKPLPPGHCWSRNEGEIAGSLYIVARRRAFCIPLSTASLLVTSLFVLVCPR